MTAPARTLSILAIPATFVLGAVVFVGACGVPLPTEPTPEATTPPVEETAATISSEAPPPSAAREERTFEPAFTPMTVRPTLTNAAVVTDVLLAEYPVLLRDAGIGGTPIVWIHIATTGEVDDARVFESSGFEALDQAAINVARAMRFTPAMNGDAVTDAWVQIPIRFQVITN
jgi:protein TonB